MATIDFDDFDDFTKEDLYESPSGDEDAISCLCFSIFREPSQPSEPSYPIGTGFIVDKNGLFVSAGHNFKSDDGCLKAKFRGKIYDLEILDKEYIEREPIEYVIGRLHDFNETITEPVFANN